MDNHTLKGVCNCSVCCTYRVAKEYLSRHGNEDLLGVNVCTKHGVDHVADYCETDPFCRVHWYARKGIEE